MKELINKKAKEPIARERNQTRRETRTPVRRIKNSSKREKLLSLET